MELELSPSTRFPKMEMVTSSLGKFMTMIWLPFSQISRIRTIQMEWESNFLIYKIPFFYTDESFVFMRFLQNPLTCSYVHPIVHITRLGADVYCK